MNPESKIENQKSKIALPFIKGLDLSQRFYDEAVGPILISRFPALEYEAARLDAGSDVLGFDTPQSRDHDWEPRLTLFLSKEDKDRYGEAVLDTMRHELPLEIGGYPTNLGRHEDGTTVMTPVKEGPVEPNIQIQTISGFFQDYLDYDPSAPPALADWLIFPEQRLRTIRSGRIFHDSSGGLTAVRERLHYYPHDLWLYRLAVQWRRIDQEEPFVGRTGDVGDELGSRLVAAGQIKNVMKLCFLMEKQYAPYNKWLGTAFANLDCSKRLTPLFEAVWEAKNWVRRQAALSAVYELMAHWHNDLDLTPPVSTSVSNFHGRPYLVIHAGNMVEALRDVIQDKDVLALPAHLGGIDQFVDSTDVLSYTKRFSAMRFMAGLTDE